MFYRHVGQHRLGIDVHRVATGGFDEAHAYRFQAFAQVFGSAQSVAQVVFVRAFFQPYGQRFEVTTRQPP